jgi:hypothetical protein
MKKIRSEKEFANWFKKNYSELGYTRIYKENKNSFPDFVMVREGKKVNVEIELRSSHFILHKHPISEVDEIICIDDDVKLNKPVIEVKKFVYQPRKSTRISIALDDEQTKVLKSLKGLGVKDAEKVKNIFLAYLSEKGYFNKK